MALNQNQISQIRNSLGESAYVDRMQKFTPVPERTAQYFGKSRSGLSIVDRIQLATFGDDTNSRRAIDSQKRKEWIKKQKAEGRMDPNEMHPNYGMNAQGNWEFEEI